VVAVAVAEEIINDLIFLWNELFVFIATSLLRSVQQYRSKSGFFRFLPFSTFFAKKPKITSFEFLQQKKWLLRRNGAASNDCLPYENLRKIFFKLFTA
jgi:hypothetical protein